MIDSFKMSIGYLEEDWGNINKNILTFSLTVYYGNDVKKTTTCTLDTRLLLEIAPSSRNVIRFLYEGRNDQCMVTLFITHLCVIIQIAMKLTQILIL